MNKKALVVVVSILLCVGIVRAEDFLTLINGYQNEGMKCRSYSCFFMKKNLNRGSETCEKSAEEVLEFMNSPAPIEKKVKGTTTYFGVPKKVAFTYSSNGNEKKITIKVHIKNAEEISALYPKALSIVDEKLKYASELWSSHTAHPLPDVQYEFIRVENQNEADFSVDLQWEITRGPYDKRWDFTYMPLQHEIGHMMGLMDEYGILSQNHKCDMTSIMCDCSNGVPLPYHYYVIYNRIACDAKPKVKHGPR